MPHNIPPTIIYTADIGALITVLGSAFGVLQGPIAVLAATLGGIFYAIQIYDRLKKDK